MLTPWSRVIEARRSPRRATIAYVRLERHRHGAEVFHFMIEKVPPGLEYQAEVYCEGCRLASRTFTKAQDAQKWLSDERLTRLGGVPCSRDCHKID